MDTETTAGRRGISEKDVWNAADALLLEGRRPTIEAVRLKFGRGSPNTITPYLDTWFKGLGKRLQDPGAFASAAAVPEPVAAAATHFWEAALAAARQEIANERAAVDAERAELAADRKELTAQRAAFEASEKALLESLRLARDQVTEALRQAQAMEERARTFEADARRLADEARAQRQALENERAASAEEAKRRDQERKDDSARFEASVKRWLTEVDQARQLAKSIAAQLDKANIALAEERELHAATRDAGVIRERELAVVGSTAERKAMTALAEASAVRVQLDDAHMTISELEQTLNASAEAHDIEVHRLHLQLDNALQAVGRAMPLPIVTAPAEARR